MWKLFWGSHICLRTGNIECATTQLTGIVQNVCYGWNRYSGPCDETPARTHTPLPPVLSWRCTTKCIFLFLCTLRRMWSNRSRRNFQGGSGPGYIDSEALQGWLLKFGEGNKKLCIDVEMFVDWLANQSLPWIAYHEFMSGRLISLNKQPGIIYPST